MIENAFKYLGFYGIDWLIDHHAEIQANTTLIDNPARTQANTAIPAAQQALTHLTDNIRTLITRRNKIPTQLPANQINPDAKRALLRAHRRAFVMTLRLLAHNTDIWLADHFNAYLQDPNEYRAITRSLMHLDSRSSSTSGAL